MIIKIDHDHRILAVAKLSYSNRRNSAVFAINDTVYLLSYSSVVACVNKQKGTITLWHNHEFSATTNKHVSKFFRETINDSFYAAERRNAINVGYYKEYRVQYDPRQLYI